MKFKTPLDVRLACRANELEGFASRALPGYLCVNVAFLDTDYADDFEAFCRANPKPCPLIAKMEPGQTDCPEYARALDIRNRPGVIRHRTQWRSHRTVPGHRRSVRRPNCYLSDRIERLLRRPPDRERLLRRIRTDHPTHVTPVRNSRTLLRQHGRHHPLIRSGCD